MSADEGAAGGNVGIAMVMLADADAAVDAARLVHFLRERFPHVPAAGDVAAQEGTLAFRLGAVDVVLGMMGAPIPWAELEGPCAASLLWRDGADPIRAHRRHVIVTVLGEPDPQATATRLTQVTAATLAACPAAIGVYWGNSVSVIPAPLFVDFATEVLPHGPPVQLWIDTRVGCLDGENMAGFTTGLAALGHMEIETVASPETAGALRERLWAIAEYVLRGGPPIGDGDTLGHDANEKIRVVHADSAFGHAGKVMRLEYGAPAPEARWRFW